MRRLRRDRRSATEPSCHQGRTARRDGRARRERRIDRGQAVALLLALVAICCLVVIAVGHFGAALVHRQRAQVAADAAALAAVEGGQSAARSLAAANGGRLVEFDAVGDEFTVTVEVDGVRATARATGGP